MPKSVILVDKSSIARVMVEIVNQTNMSSFAVPFNMKRSEAAVREACEGAIVYDMTNNDQLLELPVEPIEFTGDISDVLSDESCVIFVVQHVPEDEQLDEYSTYHLLYWRERADLTDEEVDEVVNEIIDEILDEERERKDADFTATLQAAFDAADSNTEKWENGELGRSAEHASVAVLSDEDQQQLDDMRKRATLGKMLVTLAEGGEKNTESPTDV